MYARQVLAIMVGEGKPIPPDAMYQAHVQTCAMGGLRSIITAGSVVKCLRAKAEFDYSHYGRDTACDFCWIERRQDGKAIIAPPSIMRRMAYGEI